MDLTSGPHDGSEAPPQTEFARSGEVANVILGVDWNAELPLWGTWPEGVELSEELRARLSSWQQEFDNNYFLDKGWRSADIQSHWEAQASSLAEQLQSLLADRGIVRLGGWPFNESTE
jgi:hypothetical protein